MAKRLLIMALVAMQCASLSGASLFLCLRDDGAVSIDGGPTACVCSAHELDDCPGACPAETGPATHDCDLAVVDGHADDACECTHVQISQPSVPTIRIPAFARWLRPLGDSTAVTVLPTLRAGDLSLRGVGERGEPPPDTRTLSRLIAIAVMTC